MLRSTGAWLTAIAALALATPAAAQSANWDFRLSGSTYFLPDETNYLQPTFTADRRTLHLETRYHYEGDRSLSLFAGWNFELGSTLKLELTPMIGAVFGRTDGVIPALEGTVIWRRLEFYAEGEWVIDVADAGNHFLYNWSELSLWPVDWLRTGLVTQRTRVFLTPRDIQRGWLVGANVSNLEGAFYWFNPGSEDRFFVASIGVRF